MQNLPFLQSLSLSIQTGIRKCLTRILVYGKMVFTSQNKEKVGRKSITRFYKIGNSRVKDVVFRESGFNGKDFTIFLVSPDDREWPWIYSKNRNKNKRG